MEVVRLLFREKLPDGRPPFGSQAELAKALIEADGSPFAGKNPESTRAFISQVLKPATDAGSRGASRNFRAALSLAIHERFENPTAAKAFEKKVLAALDDLKNVETQLSVTDDRVEFSALLDAARTLGHVMVFTARTAETRPSRKANQLTSVLIDRVFDDQDEANPIRYEFFVLDVGEAIMQRDSLIDQLSQREGWNVGRAVEAVEQAESCQKLSIRFLDFPYFLPPFCVFDPQSRENRTGFTLFYHEGDRVSVARMDRPTLDDWYKRMFIPLRGNEAHFHARRVVSSSTPGVSQLEQ